jgi:hypothetical protein
LYFSRLIVGRLRFMGWIRSRESSEAIGHFQ